ncbi:hypothetical protein AB0D67_11880 [Streptosporangium sp. NPDC048047]|uniref:hypothetical protein n=1 Tax=Streptosporangium sp. NPDC048047 TaxID=3155748 RepID=UPI00341728BF
MMTPSRRASRATVVTASVAIGVFGAGAGLGAVIAARSNSADSPEAGGMRLVAGTYRLDDRVGAWTALGASGAGRLSGSGQAARGAATGSTKVCLAATTDGHAIAGGASGCVALPAVAGAVGALLRPGNPRNTPAAPPKENAAPKASEKTKTQPVANPPAAPRAQQQDAAPVQQPPANTRQVAPPPPAPAPKAPAPKPAPTEKVGRDLSENGSRIQQQQQPAAEQKQEVVAPPPPPPSPRNDARPSNGPGAQSSNGPATRPSNGPDAARPSDGSRTPPPSAYPRSPRKGDHDHRTRSPHDGYSVRTAQPTPDDRSRWNRRHGRPSADPRVKAWPSGDPRTASQPPSAPRTETQPPADRRMATRPPADPRTAARPSDAPIGARPTGILTPAAPNSTMKPLVPSGPSAPANPAPQPTSSARITPVPLPSPQDRLPSADGTQLPPADQNAFPPTGQDAQPPAEQSPADRSAPRAETPDLSTLPIFRDPELMRRAQEALGLDKNMRYTDENGVWDLNIAPPGTPECRNYSEDELADLGASQGGFSVPRDSCAWPAFIRWLYADPAPGQVSNWTKFTGLSERNLELVVSDPSDVRQAPPATGQAEPGQVEQDQSSDQRSDQGGYQRSDQRSDQREYPDPDQGSDRRGYPDSGQRDYPGSDQGEYQGSGQGEYSGS